MVEFPTLSLIYYMWKFVNKNLEIKNVDTVSLKLLSSLCVCEILKSSLSFGASLKYNAERQRYLWYNGCNCKYHSVITKNDFIGTCMAFATELMFYH